MWFSDLGNCRSIGWVLYLVHVAPCGTDERAYNGFSLDPHQQPSLRPISQVSPLTVLVISESRKLPMTSQTQTSSAHSQHLTQYPQQSQRRHISKQRFFSDLSQCLFDFVIQLLPTVEEMAVKEDVRKLLERLIRTIEPDSRLLSFGSTGNGFALRNSGECQTIASITIFAKITQTWIYVVWLIQRNAFLQLTWLPCWEIYLNAVRFSTRYSLTSSNIYASETKFHVKPLPHARIPIVKLSLDPSPGLPLGIACDIGFENRLALENTRLLMCYAMVDPARVRTMVLFRKYFQVRLETNVHRHNTTSQGLE